MGLIHLSCTRNRIFALFVALVLIPVQTSFAVKAVNKSGDLPSSFVMAFQEQPQRRHPQSGVALKNEIKRQFALTIPIFNLAGARFAITSLKPSIKPFDVFMVTTGNGGNPYNYTDALAWATELRKHFRENPIFLGTAGLINTRRAVKDILPAHPFQGVTYIYEPGPEFYADVSEFFKSHSNPYTSENIDWTQENALKNLRRASKIIRNDGLIAVAKPTGRPLLQTYLWDTPENGKWNYLDLSHEVDEIWIQTQTYLKNGRWGQALNRLAQQTQHSRTPIKIQVTVSENDTNSARVDDAVAAARFAEGIETFSGMMVWWGTNSPDKLLQFIKDFRRDARVVRTWPAETQSIRVGESLSLTASVAGDLKDQVAWLTDQSDIAVYDVKTQTLRGLKTGVATFTAQSLMFKEFHSQLEVRVID